MLNAAAQARALLRFSLIMVLNCAFVTVAQASNVTEWRIDTNRSKLGFIGYYDNIAFTARFKKFSARILFDTSALDKSSFDTTIDIRSVDSNSTDRDEGMLEQAWFDTGQHPTATFIARSFKNGAKSNHFQAHGRLSIKGTSKDVILPFTWDLIDKSTQTARLSGELPLRRTDFLIGTGEWATDNTIGFDVKVFVDLYMQPVR